MVAAVRADLLILNGVPGDRAASILAVSYAPPMRAPRRAPPSLRAIVDPAVAEQLLGSFSPEVSR